jgi:hypothetical protein
MGRIPEPLAGRIRAQRMSFRALGSGKVDHGDRRAAQREQ